VSYKKALEKLKALEDKRLAYSYYYDHGDRCYCAIGSLMPEVVRGMAQQVLGKRVWHLMEVDDSVKSAMDDVGLTVEEATQLQVCNDTDEDDTPGQRYERVIQKLEQWVAIEEEATQ
jgi:hypothetical protein